MLLSTEGTKVRSALSGASQDNKAHQPPDNSSANWQAEIAAIRVLFGAGQRRDAGRLVSDLGCARVLLVSDPGIRQAGHLEEMQTILAGHGLEVCTFDGVDENPTCQQVEEGTAVASPHEPDCIVALGGGSAMDCAKGINFLLTNGGKMSDYWGFGRATEPLLPSIGIPTTAGTGSEAQSYALISDSTSHRKMACGDPRGRFRAVILDPDLTASAPRRVAAAAGLDAVSHAVETFVTTSRNPISSLLAKQAWTLLEPHLEASLGNGTSIEIRGQVLLAAHLAGAAIEQSMLGAAHAGANPLTAAFDIPHGQAIALLLPHVVRFNAVVVENDYLELTNAAGLDSSIGGGQALARRIDEMRRQAGLPTRLQQLGISAAELPELASAAAREWTAKFNPRPVSEVELLSLYESAF